MKITLTTGAKVWLHGAGAAFVGAVAACLTTGFSDPQAYNLTTAQGLRHMGTAALLAGAGATAAYFAKSPIPPQIVTEKSTLETDGAGGLIATETKTTQPAPAPESK